MKRYITFLFENYDCIGGWLDVGTKKHEPGEKNHPARSFDSIIAAKKFMEKRSNECTKHFVPDGHIVDLETGTIIMEYRWDYEKKLHLWGKFGSFC